MSSGGPSEFTEEQVEELAEKVLGKVRDKISDELSTAFYDQLSGYLYEHHMNHKQRIESEVISKMSGAFVKEPENWKFQALRKRLFEENRDELTKVLTDEVIESSVEDVLLRECFEGGLFQWSWKDAIARFVIENWERFKDDGRIQAEFVRAWEREVYKTKRLQERLAEIGEEANR